MNLDKSVENIKIIQNTTSGIHEITRTQIAILPRVVFLDCKSCDVQLEADVIKVILKPYTGIKGLYYKFKFKKKHKEWAKILSNQMRLWLPKQMYSKPIEIYWDLS